MNQTNLIKPIMKNTCLAALMALTMVSSMPVTLAQIPRGLARTRRIRVQAPPTYQYIDKTGKVKVPYKFHKARSFSEGLAPVLIGEEWGYIDKEGTLKIGAEFKLARDFHEGLAAVKVGRGWGYADKNGKIVIPAKFASCGDFKNGIAIVYVKKGDKDFPKKGKEDAKVILKEKLKNKDISSAKKAFWAIINSRKAGFINRDGTYIIKPKFTLVSPFQGELALVKNKKDYFYIDKKGEVKLKPDAQRARSFSDGLAAVKIDGKWGYIDTFGKLVIKPEFDDVQSFYSGLAAAKKDNQWGFVDKKGKWAIEPQFSSVWSGFENGVAVCAKDVSPIKNSFGTITKFNSGYVIRRSRGATKRFDESTTPLEPGYFSFPDYRFGLIDRNGKTIAPFKFGEIGDLEDGLRPAEVDGRFGYIDNIGNIAIKPQYKSASKFSNGLGMVRIGPTSSSKIRRAKNLLKHSPPALVNDPELIKKDIEVAKKVIELDSDNAQAYRDKGYFHCCLNEFKKSLADFSKVIEICPISTEGYYWRGHSYLQLKEYEKAADDFTRAIKLNRTSARLYSGRAQAYLGQKKNKLAFVDISRAIRLANRPFYHSILAKVYKSLDQNKRWLQASWRSRRCTNLNPWPAWPRSQSELEIKVKNLREQLKNLPVSVTHQEEKILVQTKLADSIDALRRLKYREEKMMELEPLFKESMKIRKVALDEASRVPISRIIKKMLTNDYANSIAQLAAFYTRKGWYDKADKLTSQALKLANKTNSKIKRADYLNDLAKLRLNQKDYKAAEESLKKSLTVSKDSKRTLMKIIRGQTLSIYSKLLVKMNRKDEAEKMLKDANEHLRIGIKLAFLPSPPIASNDSSASHYYELGVQCKSMGLIEVSRSYLKKAIEVASDDSDIKRKAERYLELYLPPKAIDLSTEKTYLTARTAEVAGDFLSAEKYYLELTKGKVKFYWPYVALARIYRENGQLAKAEKNAKKALSVNSECVEAFIELSKINDERGRKKKGIKTIKKALEIDPDNQLARFVSDKLNENKTRVE